MKILHIYDHTAPLHSGYVFRSQTLRHGLMGAGHICDIASGVRHYSSSHLKYTGDEVIDDEYYHRTKPHQIQFPVLREIADIYALARKIYGLIHTEHYDILHIHSPLLGGYAALLARFFSRLFGKNKNIKIVYEIRAFWEDAATDHGTLKPHSLKYRIIQNLETKLCHKVHHIYPICHGIKNDLIQRGVAEHKMTVIPNVINVGEFTPDKPFPEMLAQKYNLSSHHKILGFIGSFYHYEGVADLIPLLSCLLKYDTSYRLLLVGGGLAQDNINNAIGQYGLQDYVIMTGRVPHDDVADYYALCSAMIYPRHKMRLTDTTTPLKPLESMCLKKLVFLSDIDGHRELVHDGETGIFLPVKQDYRHNANIIHQTLCDKVRVQNIINNAYHYVTHHHAVDEIVKKYYKLSS